MRYLAEDMGEKYLVTVVPPGGINPETKKAVI
jgi:hypothetical protein